MHADDALIVNGGTITVTESYEGLEGLAVTINDGTIDITASDDGINTAGEKMELNGGCEKRIVPKKRKTKSL